MCLLYFSHKEYSIEHLAHGLCGDGLRGVPDRTVRNTAPLRDKVEHVIPVLNTLRAEMGREN